MSIIELKQELINRISSIEDATFLNSIKLILDRKSKEPYIELTNELEQELLIASEEGNDGKYTSQLEMDQKVEEWLKEK